MGFSVNAKVAERKNNLRGKSWQMGSEKQQKGSIRSAFGRTDYGTPEQCKNLFGFYLNFRF